MSAEPKNPYSPPRTDALPGAIEIVQPRLKIPGPVIAVVLLLSLYILFTLATVIGSPLWLIIRLLISAVILVGLIRGHALAWQWGMIMPILSALFIGTSLTLLLSRHGLSLASSLVALMLVALLIGHLAVPILLSIRSSRVFFGLQCPSCGQVKGRAANFLFSKRRCRACHTVWHHVGRKKQHGP